MGRNIQGNIEPHKPIAIVRLDDLGQAVEMSRALLEGGIKVLEFTLTNARAVETIARVQRDLAGEVLVGAFNSRFFIKRPPEGDELCVVSSSVS